MTDRTAQRVSGPLERRCARSSGGGYTAEQTVCEISKTHDKQRKDVMLASNAVDKQQDSLRCDARDIASLLGIIAALTRELESKNEYIESNGNRVAALSEALERALGFERLWARSRIAEFAVAVGVVLLFFSLYRAILC